MVLKRVILLGAFLISFCFAQNSLFFTDSYQTNIYKGNENYLIINNNLLPFLNDSAQVAMLDLLEKFGNELQITFTKETSLNAYQYILKYNTSLDPLRASKIWHQEYEASLFAIGYASLSQYFSAGLPIVNSVEHLALQKLAYENLLHFNNRNNDFSATRMHIIINQIDISTFNNEHINPNLSLNRIVTNSISHFYNEAFVVRNEEDKRYFYFGPNFKAKFEECIAMHLFCKMNNLTAPIYINNKSILILPKDLQAQAYSQEKFEKYAGSLQQEFEAIFNNPMYSFYNFFDKEQLSENFSKFDEADFEAFVNIYLDKKIYNIALSLDSAQQAFDQRGVNEVIHFKVNSIYFESELDTLNLNKIALFLINNNNLFLDIIGVAGEEEYTKIDQKQFKELVNRYKETPPVKVSKKPNLAIYRAVVIFDYLIKKGVTPKQLFCLSSKNNDQNITSAIVKFDLKQ